MKLFFLLTISLFFTIKASSSTGILPVQSQSPLMNEGPWGIDLPEQISPLQIRVLIFPHTLKKDYRHGVPDNPQRLKVFSEASIYSEKQFLGKSLTINFNKIEGFKIEGNNIKKEVKEGSLKLVSDKPISLFRENNPKKTHQYIGKIEIRTNKSGLLAINHIPIEDYVKGVVPNEVVKSWPIEVLKAQAVAARTYAVYHSIIGQDSSFWDVDDTARFQVYTGVTHSVLKTDKSVQETESEIMTFKDKVIKAYFHSYSGGMTTSAKEIFGEKDNEYCLGNEEIFSREELLRELNPKFAWIVEWKSPNIPKLDLIKQLKKSPKLQQKFKDYNDFMDITLKPEKNRGHFQSLNKLWVLQDDKEEFITYKDIRSLFGYGKIPSYWFYLDHNQPASFQFKGHGWGHHVGMSQWGAYIMANNYNYQYRDILEHYYDGISFRGID